MAAMDRDTFLPLGTSIVKLLLLASGQGALATAVGEGAGLLAKFRRTLEIGGNRAVFAEKIADDTAKQLLREHQGISEADWHVAARQTATLIDRLSKEERLAAGYNWEELRRTLLDLGGTDLRSDLADESARQAFDWVLEVGCQRIVDCFTEKEALTSILESVEEVRAGIQRLANRPSGASQTRAVVADHMEVVRDLAPDPLEDRERELAALKTFVRGSQDTWYAMEAGMVSGKTALMSSFALNPPDDVHIVSFFIRRIGGDGNDWRSFSFIAGAQLAEILGDEYTERVSDPASQDTEFRQLLRRAATACHSDRNPRPLVLLIDGIDEDSYYENPDKADAKSILSLLPRRLPEGLKVITASRPNPRPPEDNVCNAPRSVASLRASPIAQRKINTKDIEAFFKSDLAVDIGAFLAACGGSLTIDELRQLIARRHHLNNVPSRDVKACVERSPGRMLMRVNVGFGDREVESYTLGHDAVLRAVLRELAPEFFGEEGGVEDSAWWAQTRDRVLISYYQEVRGWVKECAEKGWCKTTPSFMLTEACFDLMFVGERELNASIQVIINRNRYKEVLRRSGRRSYVLRMIDREYVKVLELARDSSLEGSLASFLEAAESRSELVRKSAAASCLLKLYVSYFNVTPEVVLDKILSIDDPRGVLNSFKDTMKAAFEAERSREFMPIFPVVLRSLSKCCGLRGEVFRLLVTNLVYVSDMIGNSSSECCVDLDLRGWLYEILVCVKYNLGSSRFSSRLELALRMVLGAYSATQVLSVAECLAECIEDPKYRSEAMVSISASLMRAGETERACRVVEDAMIIAKRSAYPQWYAWFLVEVVGVFVGVGASDRARQVAQSALNAAERQMHPASRVRVLVSVVEVLVRVGDTDGACQVAQSALKVADRHEVPTWRLHGLADVAGIMAKVGWIDEALVVVGLIEESGVRGLVLAGVAKALVRVGDLDRARQIAQSALKETEQTKGLRRRVKTLVELAGVLVLVGNPDKARRVAEGAVRTVDQSETPGVRVNSVTEVAAALVQVGDPDRARQAIQHVLKVAERHKISSRRAQIVAELVKALARVGWMDEALVVAERIEESKLRSRTLGDLARVLVRVGDPDGVRDAAESALKAAEQTKEPRARAHARANALSAMAWTNIDMVLDVAWGIKEAGMRVQALVEVADILVRIGSLDRARNVVENAVRAAEQVEGPQERVQALVEVADILVRIGSLDRARNVVEDAANKVLLVDDSEGCRRVAEMLARVGAIEESLNVLTVIKELSFRSHVQSAIIVSLVRKNSSAEAISVLKAALAEVEGFVHRKEAANYCTVLAASCLEASDLIDASCSMRERWLGLARSVLARSWLYGASVWDHFDILMRVAPDLAMRLVDERILADPEQGTAPESDPDLGPEGPGGRTGSYR